MLRNSFFNRTIFHPSNGGFVGPSLTLPHRPGIRIGSGRSA